MNLDHEDLTYLDGKFTHVDKSLNEVKEKVSAVNDRVVKVEIHQDLHAERIAGVEHAQTNHVKKHHNPIQSAKNILIVVTLISILVGLFVTIGGMMGWL